MLAAFMVKSAVVPFHFWLPDLHASAPTGVSAVLSAVVIKLGVYGFIRMSTLLFVDQSNIIRSILVFLGVIGVIFGGLSAVGTHNLKRMLAFSSLSQVGFILVGIGWGTTLSMAAAIVFTFNHSLIKAAMLMLAGYISSRGTTKSLEFTAVKGSGKPMPTAGVLFFLGSLALAGIPPTNGFVSKMLLFTSGIAAEGFWALLLIGITSLLTMIYTIRAFILIWWSKPEQERKSLVNGDRLLAPLILITLVVIFGLWAEPLVNMALETSTWLSDPLNYIQAVLGG
jgi:multicomponent Na+:H+ antiporter subunit D